MRIFKQITHIIYDMDGVLLDTEPFYTQVTQSVVEQHGKQFDWHVKAQMLGRQPLVAARILVDALDLPITPEAYLAQRNALLEKLFPTAQPLPGAVALTQHFKQCGITQAVATSTTQRAFHLKTLHHKAWFETFDYIITGDDAAVKQGKPAPDIFLAAAQGLHATPEQCLVFEDAPAGLAAAQAAGMSVVVIPDPMMDKTLCQTADQILPSLTVFQPELWGLPPFPH